MPKSLMSPHFVFRPMPLWTVSKFQNFYGYEFPPWKAETMTVPVIILEG